MHGPEHLTRHPKIFGREGEQNGWIVECSVQLNVKAGGTVGPPLDRQPQRERCQLRQSASDCAVQRVGLDSEHEIAADGVGPDVEPERVERDRLTRGVDAGADRAGSGVVQPQLACLECAGGTRRVEGAAEVETGRQRAAYAIRHLHVEVQAGVAQPPQRNRQTGDIECRTSLQRGRREVADHAPAFRISAQDDGLRDALVERQRPRVALQFEIELTGQAERAGLRGGSPQPGRDAAERRRHILPGPLERDVAIGHGGDPNGQIRRDARKRADVQIREPRGDPRGPRVVQLQQPVAQDLASGQRRPKEFHGSDRTRYRGAHLQRQVAERRPGEFVAGEVERHVRGVQRPLRRAGKRDLPARYWIESNPGCHAFGVQVTFVSHVQSLVVCQEAHHSVQAHARFRRFEREGVDKERRAVEGHGAIEGGHSGVTVSHVERHPA